MKNPRRQADVIGKRTPHRLAKLTRPSANRLVSRDRLFRAMDDTAQSPILWVSGAPGVGKTSLVSSYLERRGYEALWIQLDDGDSDEATFLHYLSIGAGGFLDDELVPATTTAPGIRPDGTDPFRMFFRTLFSRLEEGTFLVLDNYHELSDASPLHASLVRAFEEIPTGFRVIVSSQVGPPRAFSRLIANGSVAILDGEHLRLTFDEARAIACVATTVPLELLPRLHERAEGWAAGWILLLEAVRRLGAVPPYPDGESFGRLFDYFSERLFERLAPSQQDILMQLSCLPRPTRRIATMLTEQPSAAPLLDHLAQRNLFVCLRPGQSETYEFHSLFRAFLKARSERIHGADQLREIARKAAQLLEGEGLIDEAVRLYVEARAWDSARRLILREAEKLARQGRRRTLRDWIASLPSDDVEANPWLSYWLAVGELTHDYRAARIRFERAGMGFRASKDRQGEVSAVAHIAESFFDEQASLDSLHEWLARLRELLSSRPFDPESPAEVRALATLARLMLFRIPGDARIPALFGQLDAVVRTATRPAVIIGALNVVLAYRVWRGEAIECEELQLRGRGLIENEDVPSIDRVWFHYWLSFYQLYSRRLDDAAASIAAGRLIATERGAVPTVLDFDRLEAWRLLAMGMISDARELLEQRVRPSLATARLGVVMHYYEHLAECASADGDLVLAREHIECGLRASGAAGHSWVTTNLRAVAARLYVDLGLEKQARAQLKDMWAIASASDNPRLLGEYWIVKAYLARKRGDPGIALVNTRAALRHLTHGRVGYLWPTAWVVPRLSELWASALQHGIEVDYVARSINVLGLAPPGQQALDWPWRVRIRTLGEFSVEVDHRPLRFGHKPQQKPLELLRMLVTETGTRVSASRVVDRMWPEAAGDTGFKALEITLYRLRKLLGVDGVVAFGDGVIRVDRNICCVDAWSFDAMIEAMQPLVQGSDEWRALAASAVRLYRGHLLETETSTQWAQTQREALRRRWVRLICQLGHTHEAAKDWADAELLYSEALAVDPTAEEFYRGLIALHARSGARSRVVEVYRMCHTQLIRHLGVPPSQETQALVRAASARG